MPERNLSRDKITRYLEEGDVLLDHAPSCPWSLADVRAPDGQWEERGWRGAAVNWHLGPDWHVSRAQNMIIMLRECHSCQNIQNQERRELALLFRSFKFKHLSVWIWLLKGSDKQWVCDDADSTHSLHSRAPDHWLVLWLASKLLVITLDTFLH